MIFIIDINSDILVNKLLIIKQIKNGYLINIKLWKIIYYKYNDLSRCSDVLFCSPKKCNSTTMHVCGNKCITSRKWDDVSLKNERKLCFCINRWNNKSGRKLPPLQIGFFSNLHRDPNHINRCLLGLTLTIALFSSLLLLLLFSQRQSRQTHANLKDGFSI